LQGVFDHSIDNEDPEDLCPTPWNVLAYFNAPEASPWICPIVLACGGAQDAGKTSVVWVVQSLLPPPLQYIEGSQHIWNAKWPELGIDSHTFERIKVIELKPPWPHLVPLQLEQLTVAKFTALMYLFSRAATLCHYSSSGKVILLSTAARQSDMIQYEKEFQTTHAPGSVYPKFSSLEMVVIFSPRFYEGQATCMFSVMNIYSERMVSWNSAIPQRYNSCYWTYFVVEPITASFLQILGSYSFTCDHNQWDSELTYGKFLRCHSLPDCWFQFCPARKASLHVFGATEFQWEIAWPITTLAYSVRYAGLLNEVLVQGWIFCFNGHIIQYGFGVNQWMIAWFLHGQYFFCGNKIFQLSCANTQQVFLLADWTQFYPTVTAGCNYFNFALLFSWDVISTFDRVPAIKYNHGIISHALPVLELGICFAAAILLLSSHLSQAWVL